jgi:hypothetical protein
MLLGDTGKYLGIVAGAMFAGILTQIYFGITAVHADIWVMDQRLKVLRTPSP